AETKKLSESYTVSSHHPHTPTHKTHTHQHTPQSTTHQHITSLHTNTPTHQHTHSRHTLINVLPQTHTLTTHCHPCGPSSSKRLPNDSQPALTHTSTHTHTHTHTDTHTHTHTRYLAEASGFTSDALLHHLPPVLQVITRLKWTHKS